MAISPKSLRRMFYHVALSIGLTITGQSSLTQDFQAVAAELATNTTTQSVAPSVSPATHWSQPSVWGQIEELIKTEDGQKRLIEAAKDQPLRALSFHSKFIGLGESDLAKKVRFTACSEKLLQAVKDNKSIGLRHLSSIIDTPIAKDVLDVLVEHDPENVFALLKNIDPKLYTDDRTTIADLRESTAMKIVQTRPDIVIKSLQKFNTMSFGAPLLREVIKVAPEAILTLSEEDKTRLYPTNTSNEIANIENELRKSCLSKIKVRDEDGASNLIKIMNKHHKEPKADRTRFLSAYQADDIFFVLAQTANITYRDTYNDLHDRLHIAMQEENISPLDLVKTPSGQHSINDFIYVTSKSGQLDRFFNACRTPKERAALSRSVMSQIAESYLINVALMPVDLEKSDTATIAMDTQKRWSPLNIGIVMTDYLKRLSGPNEQTAALDVLANLYKNTTDPILKTTIGCAVSTYYVTSGDHAVPHQYFTTEEEITKKYPVSTPQVIPESNLFKNGKCVVLMRFYEDGALDTDTVDSFDHMQKYYKSKLMHKNGWRVEEQKGYVLIKNETNPQRKIWIVANRPNSGDLFNSEVKAKFFAGAEPNVTVTRGHTEKIQLISQNDKPTGFGLIGGCDGYSNMSHVTEAFGDTPVIVSNGTGYMAANETILSTLLEQARDKGSLNLKDSWTRIAEVYKGKGFESYIRPDENMSSAMHAHLPRFLNLLKGRQELGPDAPQPFAPTITPTRTNG